MNVRRLRAFNLMPLSVLLLTAYIVSAEPAESVALQEGPRCFDCWYDSMRNEHWCTSLETDGWQDNWHGTMEDSTCESHGHNECDKIIIEDLLTLIDSVERSQGVTLAQTIAKSEGALRLNMRRNSVQVYAATTCSLEPIIVADIPLTREQLSAMH